MQNLVAVRHPYGCR